MTMKILLVAGFFPPYAPIAATRVNKLAKYWYGQGYDIRVLAAHNQYYPPVMAVEVPEKLVHFTPVYEIAYVPGKIKSVVKRILGRQERTDNSSNEASGTGAAPDPDKATYKPGWISKAVSSLVNLYASIVSVPDARIGWYPYAVQEGRKILSDWKPDLIYASAPPHTSLLVASKLAREFDIPWFCEYRDLWVDHPYYDGSWLRRLIEKPLERRTLSNCAGLITVTKTWADHLKALYDKPVAFIMNGYDPADYMASESLSPLDPDNLAIVYAGGIYPGKRDPSLLFQVLKQMGDKAARVRMHFFMPDDNTEMVRAMAEEAGIEDLIVMHGLVPRKDVLRYQQICDVLLLLRWDSPEENGVLAGKLFEYIGAGRPILSIGSVTGEAAEIIRQNDFGLVSKDIDEIKQQIEIWLSLKSKGQIPAPGGHETTSFSRIGQFEKLQKFLRDCLTK